MRLLLYVEISWVKPFANWQKCNIFVRNLPLYAQDNFSCESFSIHTLAIATVCMLGVFRLVSKAVC